MSKKDYIDAMNEINPRESLKKETYNKITKNKIKRYGRIYPILSMAAMILIIVAIGVPLSTSKLSPMLNQKQDTQIIETATLEKVGSFENLYTKLKEMQDTNDYEKYLIDGDLVITDAVSEEGDSSQNKEFSSTNVQEENVDEGDIVKTDGNYIYYMTSENIAIISVTNNNELKVVSKIDFDEEFRADEMFLRNDRLVTIGYKYTKDTINPLIDDTISSSNVVYNECKSVIRVYNISSREKPEIIRTVEVDGRYISARMVEDNIYLMTNKYISSYIFNKYEIDELNEDAFKPSYIDTAISKDEQKVEFSNIYCIPDSDSSDYLNVVSFNVMNDEPANIESYMGAGSQIYASEKNMYVTKSNYNFSVGMKSSDNVVTTDIYKFKLEGAKCTFEKSGVVPGTIINQFSMDEEGEYFRIATTASKDGVNTNNLYVLNADMEIVGKVEDLAKDERIYSVRFIGNRAYMVTFVQTDPLFVIDLSDPTNPTVLGELKIPGYSKYLHPYDETHLIGFGEKTRVVNYGYGDQVITDGMKMALFDVSDPTNPKEMYNVDIGERGTYSELLYNHKALLFSKEKNIIAFPISITEDNYNVKFNGAIVYGLDLENGFTLKGKISHMDNANDLYYSNKRVDRIIYIGNTLFTLSDNLVKAIDINTMKELNNIEL